MKIIPLGVWGGYPKANSANSSFLIEEGGFHLLFDCGSGVLSSVQNYIKVQQLDAVLVSHFHHDHIADIGPLQYAKLIQNQLAEESKILPIYAPGEDKYTFEKLSSKEDIKAYAIEENHTYQIGPFQIRTIRTTHPVYCLAFRIETKKSSVVLTADTAWQESFVPFADKADLIISESNLYEHLEGKIPGHMSGREAGELANKANAGQLLLTHLPHFGNLNDLVVEASTVYSGHVELAQAGKTYHLR
ncbi:MBL fold metallo-hydrolase [Gracilibacillus sp. YIM 98692]|uniref:MBL fold metallo-hydrolase n=1 Tax=Gracilibacillus sp. YIM 98692 TaxID=2663532 RepID=UPI0013D218BA|nr:MBL fold metallo-hydrolase [Gracilibacillus sp. YIM 98692]